MDDSEIPDINDLAGLTRLCWKAVQNIRSQSIPANERREWLDLIKAHSQAAAKLEGRYGSNDL